MILQAVNGASKAVYVIGAAMTGSDRLGNPWEYTLIKQLLYALDGASGELKWVSSAAPGIKLPALRPVNHKSYITNYNTAPLFFKWCQNHDLTCGLTLLGATHVLHP